MNRETATAYGLAAVGAVGGAWKYGIRPELTARRGWLAIGTLAVAHELACPPGELLSEGVDRGLEHSSLAKAAIAAGIGGIALHLLNVFPENRDPVSGLLKAAKRL